MSYIENNAGNIYWPVIFLPLTTNKNSKNNYIGNERDGK